MGDLLCLLEYDKQFRKQKRNQLEILNKIYRLNKYNQFIYDYICDLDYLDIYNEIRKNKKI